MLTKPKRWSYSSISCYGDCPRKYLYQYINKLPRPKSSAADRGTLLHSLAEEWMLKKPGAPIPGDLVRIAPQLDALKTHNAQPEVVWLVDRDWRPVEDPDKAWCKAIVDVHYVNEDVLYISDYKSGRTYPSHTTQLELYSILGLLHYPTVHRVESRAIYIDKGFDGAEGSLLPRMAPFYISQWTERAVKMESDNTFDPTPGAACRFCPYKSDKGGPCDHFRRAL